VRIRFQADNDLRKAILYGVVREQPLIDFRSAQTAKLENVPDPQVLASTADDGCILISHDFQTMPAHFRQFILNRTCPGVFLIRQDLPVSHAIESLLLIWEASEPGDWANRLCLIPSLVTIAIGGEE
jgi:hypothetical protein